MASMAITFVITRSLTCSSFILTKERMKSIFPIPQKATTNVSHKGPALGTDHVKWLKGTGLN